MEKWLDSIDHQDGLYRSGELGFQPERKKLWRLHPKALPWARMIKGFQPSLGINISLQSPVGLKKSKVIAFRNVPSRKTNENLHNLRHLHAISTYQHPPAIVVA
ncbi:hypothetical protein [Echinicola vietnamensis]|uniref:hypothetical protein n=1 Tax=Echinicola vietnamensis TaxID=390884 RepID=UPI0005A13700|nr:hypothetical protein [Echinicola vietnamensis]